MMLDADIVAVSPTSVWRVLGQAGLLSKWNGKSSKKGTGFEQPLAAHQHWHIDVSYINVSGTFYYLCSILDGCSRYIVNWDLRESMTEADIEIILERAKEIHPEARPVIGDDPGPGFRVILLRYLQDDLDVRLGHRLPQIPVDDVAATAVQNAAQVVEHHECQPPIAFQRILQMEADDGLLFPERASGDFHAESIGG